MNGILLVDKPLHLSSNHLLQRVKRLLGSKKAGHTGSLDPLATGMLPICLGEATKFSQFLLDAQKTYRTRAVLGATSTTGDLEGEIVEKKEASFVTPALLEKTLSLFRGESQQIPPMYSALKKNGRPLYELAREGCVVERLPRKIIIYQLELLGFEKGACELLVTCSKGTYIRTLVEDIGVALGCGAYVARLHRVGVSSFDEQQMVSLLDLEKYSADEAWLAQHLLPVDAGIAHWPVLQLSQIERDFLYFGQALVLNETLVPGVYRLYFEKSFLGIADILGDGLSVNVRRLMSRPEILPMKNN